MKYTEKRTLSCTSLRSICIRNNWYTRGTCEQYDRLFSLIHENGEPVNMTTEKLAEVAEDIIAHSDMDDDCEVTSVMFELAASCTTCFQEV